VICPVCGSGAEERTSPGAAGRRRCCREDLGPCSEPRHSSLIAALTMARMEGGTMAVEKP
jgi:hypothetical protein